VTIQECRFVYADQSSLDFDIWGFVTIGNQRGQSNDEETNPNMTKSAFRDTWNFHGLEYVNPLSFDLTICKANGKYIDANEQRIYKKWLCKNKMNWLSIYQDDISDVHYNCVITNPRTTDIGNMTAGMNFTVTCDSPYPWSGLKSKEYKTVDGILNFDFNHISDFDDYILYPVLIIDPTVNGNISIKNNTTNKTVVINNCVTTETIIIDCKNDKIKSSNGRLLLDSWNKEFFEIVEGLNNITLTGNFDLTMEYRLPIRVGA